jgi:hypothetical protein
MIMLVKMLVLLKMFCRSSDGPFPAGGAAYSANRPGSSLSCKLIVEIRNIDKNYWIPMNEVTIEKNYDSH